MSHIFYHHKNCHFRIPRESVWKAILCIIIAFMMLSPVNAQNNGQPHTLRYYVSRAENYLRSNSWQELKREVDEGLVHYPDDPELRYLNGRYYFISKDIQEARYNFIRAIQEDDQHFKAKRMLVDVEDDLKHYSSAICYINELLEFQPYDRDLWRRKISLYRKIGNLVEADAALQRLAQIYPNDSIVRIEMSNRTREKWNSVLQKCTLEEAADNLEQWMDYDPNNLSYYLELISTYERMGEYERALGVVNRGLIRFPRNNQLVHKGLGIMTGMGLYTQALTFAKQNSNDKALYASLLQEVADDARLRDPYESNGRLYEINKNPDALTYLINTALTRGYWDEARYYLKEAMKNEGRSVSLLAKQYQLEKRCGDEQAALKILEELYELKPEDVELTAEYASLMLELGSKDINNQLWHEAYLHLDRSLQLMSPEHPAWSGTVARQIIVLGHLGRFNEARKLCREMGSKTNPNNALRFGSAYEEIASVHIAGLIEEERYEEALHEAKTLLEIVNNSEPALRCCINMCQTLKLDKEFQEYALQGYHAYPYVPYFIIKHAVSLRQQKRSMEALDLIRPNIKDGNWISPQLSLAYSGIASEWAMELNKNHMSDLALTVVDSALVYDASNKELLYMKGLIYEKLKMYDQAYAYQSRYYEPSNAEQQEYYEHMRFLKFRSLKNRVDASYTRATYDTREGKFSSIARLYSLATVSYTRIEKRDTYTGQISYKGIDGYHVAVTADDGTTDTEDEAGGTGLEFMGQWEHIFDHRWSGMANLAYSTQFFNKWSVNVSASYAADNDWTPSLRLGYRYTPPTYLYLGDAESLRKRYDTYHLFLFSPSVSKSWEQFQAALNTDLILMEGGLYYNVGLKGSIFINDDHISSVSLITGFGSFPELTFFEQTALQGLSHTNTMIGFHAQYLCTRNMYVGLSGNWNTCYNPYRQTNGTLSDSYLNIFSLNAQLHIAF